VPDRGVIELGSQRLGFKGGRTVVLVTFKRG
jgi:hypothetical protein